MTCGFLFFCSCWPAEEYLFAALLAWSKVFWQALLWEIWVLILIQQCENASGYDTDYCKYFFACSNSSSNTYLRQFTLGFQWNFKFRNMFCWFSLYCGFRKNHSKLKATFRDKYSIQLPGDILIKNMMQNWNKFEFLWNNIDIIGCMIPNKTEETAVINTK